MEVWTRATRHPVVDKTPLFYAALASEANKWPFPPKVIGKEVASTSQPITRCHLLSLNLSLSCRWRRTSGKMSQVLDKSHSTLIAEA